MPTVYRGRRSRRSSASRSLPSRGCCAAVRGKGFARDLPRPRLYRVRETLLAAAGEGWVAARLPRLRRSLAEGCRMTCPKCGQKPRAIKTEEATEGHARLLECATHGRFWSLERLWKWVVKIAGNGRATAPQRLDNGPATAIAVRGDREGSGLVSSGVPDPNPKASLLSEPRARVGKKGRPSTEEYTPEFEKFWASISVRRGNKYPAFKAWVKIPAAISHELIFTRYEQWAATPQWRDGFPPHVATWLNARGWDTEPSPADLRPRNGAPKPYAQRVEDDREQASMLRRFQLHVGGGE